MNARNYQKELEAIIDRHQKAGEVPRLLIHACCAPCSSYVMEYLSRYFQIDFYFYNPNIDTAIEYEQRKAELVRLAGAIPAEHPIGVVSEDWDPEAFYRIAKGHEQDPERGERCLRCYELRLRKTAAYMKAQNQALSADGGPDLQRQSGTSRYDYFATTLSISPLKSAQALNEIGERIALEYGLSWLPSDFKKKGGYLRSTELSRAYGLYRQDYCGCVYSKQEAKRRNEKSC